MNRHITKKKIIVAVLILSFIFLTGWRLWPHSLSKIILIDKSAVSNLSCNANISGIETSGTTFIDSYVLQSPSINDENFDMIMNILNATEYRQDFRNLLPWPISSVDSDEQFDGKSATVFLSWGNKDDENCYLCFAGDSVTVSINSDDGLHIYHAVDKNVINKLVDYIKENGIPN